MYKSIGLKGRHILFGALIIALIVFSVRCAVSGAGAEQNAKTPADIVKFLAGFGWEAETVPLSVKNVQIPVNFNEVYEQYNELQKKQGYDLSKYRSEYAVSYSFRINNHPSDGEVFANVLVIGGRVVGGDLCSYALNGFMTGFDGKTT